MNSLSAGDLIALATIFAVLAVIFVLPSGQFKRSLRSVLGIIGWAVLVALPLAAIGYSADAVVFFGSFTEDRSLGLGKCGVGIGAMIGAAMGTLRFYNARRM